MPSYWFWINQSDRLSWPVWPETGLTAVNAEDNNSAKTLDQDIKAEATGWGGCLSWHIWGILVVVQKRNFRRLAFNYILIDDELYRPIVEDFLLKCVDLDQNHVAMGEVHEGIFETH